MQSCEDRNYQCCDAFPPAPGQTWVEYLDWYDAHVARWETIASFDRETESEGI